MHLIGDRFAVFVVTWGIVDVAVKIDSFRDLRRNVQMVSLGGKRDYIIKEQKVDFINLIRYSVWVYLLLT